MANPSQPQNEPTITNPAEEESAPAQKASDTEESPSTSAAALPKWRGWPGDNVFRLIVPVLTVGSIIGRKGELIKKICDETQARVRILDAPSGTPHRVVLISGKEEPDAPLSPAMEAVIRVFKHVTGLSESDDKSSAPDAAAFCSIRLLVASTQAISLIGKHGSTIKSIQETAGAVVRIMPEGELPSYATYDERIVEIHGEAFKVQKALEAVLGHLRKFLHDHSVVAVFEKTYNETISQNQTSSSLLDRSQPMAVTALSQTLIGIENSLPLRRETYFDRDIELDMKLPHSSLSLYGSDSALSGLHSSGLTRAAAPIVTQMTQTMQVPLSYAEDIIGIAGRNIAYIRRTSGAVLTVEESLGRPDEITVEIKGSASQVQIAQQLIQESINNHKAAALSLYSREELGLSSYSRLSDTKYRPSSFSGHNLGGGGSSYTSSGLGGLGGGRTGYGSYRF